MNPIIARCAALASEGHRITVVTAAPAGPSRMAWEVAVGLGGMVPDDEVPPDPSSPYAVTVDRDNLPPGVQVMAWSAIPPDRFMVTASEEGVEAMMADVARIGLAVDQLLERIGGNGPEYPRFRTAPNRWHPRRELWVRAGLFIQDADGNLYRRETARRLGLDPARAGQ
jgi:hypothetical protein